MSSTETQASAKPIGQAGGHSRSASANQLKRPVSLAHVARLVLLPVAAAAARFLMWCVCVCARRLPGPGFWLACARLSDAPPRIAIGPVRTLNFQPTTLNQQPTPTERQAGPSKQQKPAPGRGSSDPDHHHRHHYHPIDRPPTDHGRLRGHGPSPRRMSRAVGRRSILMA